MSISSGSVLLPIRMGGTLVIVNALVHKKYGGAAIQIRVFDDRLSIWNEGVLPAGLTIESLKTEHNSKPPNPLIADVCFKAGYIDTWGRGTLKIIKACEEAGLPEPSIIEKDGGIEVTIYKVDVSEQLRRSFGVNAEEFRSNFGDKKALLLFLIALDPRISAKRAAEKIGVSARTVENYFSDLKGKYINRYGSDKDGRWKIVI